jgi:uncharacterized protein YjdB
VSTTGGGDNLNAVITAVKPGTTTITASTGGSGGVSGTYPLTVSPVPVESITLNKTSIELATSSTFQLSATVAPENAADKRVTWSVSPEGIVALNSTTGPAVTITATAAGAATITATANDGSGKTATCAVTVKAGNGFVISPPDFGDEAITLSSIPDLSKRANDTFTVTVTGSYKSIRWYEDSQTYGDSISNSYRISASNFSVSTHFLTVVVETNGGKYFSKELPFRVVE